MAFLDAVMYVKSDNGYKRVLYIKTARGNGKSMLQLEHLRKLLGISDEEWAETVRKAREELGWPEEESCYG